VIGYLNYAALDALFAVDPRFNRVLQRNYFMQVMNWFKPTVPFLRYSLHLSALTNYFYYMCSICCFVCFKQNVCCFNAIDYYMIFLLHYRDMDDWSLALLSCKVALKGFRPDTTIYQRDSPSDFAYIIVGGAIKVTKNG